MYEEVSMSNRRWQHIMVFWLLISLASCSGQSATSPKSAQAPTSVPIAACAKAGTPIGQHPKFPANFPLPPGMMVTSWEERSADRVIMDGFAPGDVQGVAVFLQRELPAAGFKPTFGESEPGEAEGAFEGNGYRGRWKTNSIQGCEGAVTFTVVTGP